MVRGRIVFWRGETSLGVKVKGQTGPRVTVNPGVAAAAVQGLHNLVFADPEVVYIRTVPISLLATDR